VRPLLDLLDVGSDAGYGFGRHGRRGPVQALPAQRRRATRDRGTKGPGHTVGRAGLEQVVRELVEGVCAAD
jgi:hypothetical protein